MTSQFKRLKDAYTSYASIASEEEFKSIHADVEAHTQR